MLTLEVNTFVAIDIRTMAVINESRGLTDLLFIGTFDRDMVILLSLLGGRGLDLELALTLHGLGFG